MKSVKIIALLLVLVTSLTLFACGGEGKTETAGGSEENGSAVLPDGVRIREISVDMVGSTPNFVLILANDNDADTEVDCSKFVLKKADGTELTTSAGVKTLEAGESYTQFAFPVSGELEVGDTVSVYYGGELIEEVTVTEF